MQNYSYLRPPTKFLRNYEAPTHRSGTGERLIYGGNNIKMNDEQSQAVLRLREYIKHKNPQKEYDNNLLLRCCYLGGFKTTDSLDKFRYYEEWWAMPNVPKDTERAILHSGVFYCYGKDVEYSPNIYFHPARINLNDFNIQEYLGCLRTLLTPIEQKMLFPGKIQKWNLIIDSKGFNDSKFKSNYSIIMNNLIKVQYSYPYRIKRIFLISSGGTTGLWSKVGFGSNSQELIGQAIKQLNLQSQCIRINSLHQFNNYIPVEEREKQYGGTLEDLYQFWPIPSTNKLMQVNSKFIEGSEDSIEYNSIINDNSLFADKETKKILCNFRQSCSIQ